MMLEITLGQAVGAATLITVTSGAVSGLASWIWARARQEAEWLTADKAKVIHPLRYEVYTREEANMRFSRHDICVVQHAALEDRHHALERKIDDGFSHMEKLVREIVKNVSKQIDEMG